MTAIKLNRFCQKQLLHKLSCCDLSQKFISKRHFLSFLNIKKEIRQFQKISLKSTNSNKYLPEFNHDVYY